MNTDNNARFQETEKKIRRAYGRIVQKKQVGQITVSDICREAGIHRTTFYGHYQDVVELAEQVEKSQLLKLFNEFQIEDTWDLERGMAAVAGFCKQNKDIIKRQMKNLGLAADIRVLSPNFVRSMERKFGSEMSFASDPERYYTLRFYGTGAMAVLTAWIERDCAEPEEEIVRIVCGIVDKISNQESNLKILPPSS